MWRADSGAGNDTYVFNAKDGNDTILETHGDSGIDTIQFGTDITVGDISLAREGPSTGSGQANLVFRHINGRDSVTVAHWFTEGGKNKLDTVTFADGRSFDLNTLQLGTINPDILTALATTPGGVPINQILAGGAGNDTLNGGAGNDWLLGGAGADTMAGGAGNDTYSVDNPSTGSGQAPGDVVIENAGQGIDVVEASVNYTLTNNVENLTLVGAGAISGTGNTLDNLITGNAADNALYGMDGNDTLVGNAGNDTLDGGKGADTLIGGVGDDTYIVDNAGDVVVENMGEGADNVQASISYTLTNNVENLALTGTANINGTGNALDNVITGNAGNNVLSGMEGSDTLYGNVAANDSMLLAA